MDDVECLFCRIASGRVPARFVDATPHVVAFLDLHPIRRGHVRVVPRHFPYYDDLRPTVAAELMRVAQRPAPALRTSFGVEFRSAPLSNPAALDEAADLIRTALRSDADGRPSG
jgi:histidine triad (HIT) family protein